MSNSKVVNNNIEDVFSLSPIQEGMLFHSILDSESSSYVVQNVFSINKQLKIEFVREALKLLFKRYSVLRINFFYEKIEKPRQVVLRNKIPELVVNDYLNYNNADFEKEFALLLKKDVERGFDLKKGSLLRVNYIDLNGSSKLVWTMHHIIVDGWCINTLFEKFMYYYTKLSTGEPSNEIEEEIISEKCQECEYSEYLKWLGKQDKEKAIKYWEDELEGYESDCEIKAIRKPEHTEEQVREVWGSSDFETTEKLKNIAERNESTINTAAEAAVGIMLQSCSGSKDVVFGKVVSGRNADIPGIEKMVGLFVNTIPVRVTAEDDITVTELLKKQQEKDIESTNYDYCSIAEIQSKTAQGSDLIKVLYVFENYMSGVSEEASADEENSIRVESAREQTNYGISISGFENEGKLGFKIMYDPNKYCDEEIHLIMERLLKICEEMANKPDAKICELETVTEAEKQLILNDFNATETEYPRDKTVVELFEEQVKKIPDNIALVFEDEKLTYAELNARANSLAYKLRENGVKPDDFVAIIADRSIEMICGIYGIIKAGGAYVPIDPTYPEERIRFMLEDCQPKAVLKYTAESIKLNNEIAVIDLADGKVWEGASENPEHVNTANDLIYCIYTSGTTGKPKGVANRHQGIVNLISWMQEKYPLSEEDVILQKTTYVFDVSASEIFWWFMAGAKLALLKPNAEKEPEVIAEEIQKYGVTVIDFVPSMLSVFMVMSEEYIEQIKGLRYILAAGEALNANLVKEFYAAMKRHNSKTLLGNIYGPTEAAVYSTYYDLNPEFESETVLIGRPVANVKAYITNGENLCGIGVPGELCIAGDGLARGYLNRPELTAEKFVKNPFGEGRMYRSGDLAKWLPDGNIEYLGRIDEQVKIRGFRIELGEIESRIREIEGIRDCAVTARADSTGDKAIYAYYTSDTEVSVSEIRDRLGESLPEYMVPAYMTQIESIPVTRNGKLDKRALPEIEAKATREYAAPRNEIEEKICNIFSEILNVEQVGIKDSFFELGGHSLRATRLVNRIEAETGTRIALKEVFAHPTAEQLAVLAGAESEEYVPIPKAEEKEYYPMSSAQKRTYLIQQMQPEAVTYNMPQNMKLMGEVYPEKLKEAMQEMINRHEILRTQFLMIDGEPVQKIIDHAEADFEYVTSKEPDEKLISEYMKPFDLESGKTIRAKLVNKGEYHLLTLDMHHIVGDGMSMNTFMREVMALYNGEKLEPLTRQFKDYSEWMRSRDLRGQEEYWKSRFEDEIPVLDMPTDYPRPQEQRYAGTMTGAALDEEASRGVKKLISRSGATDYMVFLAAAMVTLSKYSRQEDIVIGSPISGRTHRDTESMLGMFVNTLAMRGKPEKKKTFIQFLKEIKSTCLKAYENQEYPFEELVEAAEVQRDMSRNPLFDVMLVMQNNESTELRLGNSSIEGTVIESTAAKFDMTFNINEYNGRYVIGFEYCTDLFKKETAERILEHYIEILKAVTENAEMKLGDIEMVTSEEKSLILNDFNATETEYPRDKTVVELFEEQVRKTPDNTALVFEEESLTYAELNARANSLAYKLRENGVKPDDFVAIIADRSIEMICGIYGIIKAGGAYVPIDPTYPEERIRFMLEDCQPKAVLKYTAESIKPNNETAVIDLADGKVWEGASENPEHVNTANDLIYCIYTSGTTGKPKGSIIENKSVVRLVKNTNYIELDEHNVILQTGSMSFDASTLEVWGALLNGGKLVISTQDVITDSEKLRKLMSREKVNTMWLTSTLFNQMISEENDIFDSLEHLLIGGEKLSDDHVRIMKSRNNGVKLTNGYGPTENTTFTTTYEIPAGFEIIPIGKPISNTKVYIANGENLCGIGVPGELCIAGDGLARGYLNRPELTEEKFVNNPFGEGRMYRSGDLARWLSDGNIEYLGRIDEQVKIRGFRIELGEIESRIREIEGIRDCAVTARADSTGDKAIYAYYTSDTEVSVSEIRDRLSESLPEYMVPAYMTQIESIPVTRNGKLDKRALPEIETKNTREYAAPRNEIEEAVCHAFSEILNVEQVGIKDSFFELGGDSIKAIRIISKLRNAGYTATVKDVMNGKTAEKIAFVVKNANEKQKYEQGEVTGKIESTPIIREFAEWNLAKPEHFNQAMMFSVDGIDNETIHKAIEELVKHHDILRAVYRNNELEIMPTAESRLCDFYEFDYRNEADKPSAVAEKCTEIQGSVDLENGPLVKIAVFELGETKQMMFCIHHLAVDGVSWRILSEDFETAAGQLKEGKEVVLPEKTASFAEWSKKLKEYGEQLGSKEKDYWKKANAKIAEGKIAGEYTETETGYTVVEFSKETTEKLLTKSSNAYGAKIDEVLIAGLARAVGRVTGQKSVAIKLEGHGREEIHEPISIDRTVGWFTNVYAVSVECSEDNDEAIINAKDTIRSVPNMGMGYGYVEHETMPDICFNYLGDFSGSKTSYMGEYSCGRDISEENSLPDRITINGQVMNGVLKFIIMSLNGQNLADRLKKEFEKSVDELAGYCAEEKHEEKTVSDYGISDLSSEEFAEMQKSFTGEVEKIYDLTPLQAGMLFHNLEDRGSTGYVVQSVYKTEFEVEAEKLREAIKLLSRRYEVLRTGFVYEKVSEPKQIVYAEREPELEILETSDEESKQISEADINRGFDLSRDTMLRVKSINIGKGKSKIVLTVHHIIMDGWCMGTLVGKLFEYYFRLEKGEAAEKIEKEIGEERRKAGEYSEYIEWLGKQDTEKAERYWKEELEGYESDCEIKAIRKPEPTEEQMREMFGEASIAVTKKLKEEAERTGSTINTAAEAAVGIMLQSCSGSKDVVFGKVVSGRNADIPGIEKMVGLFVNTIPVRVTAEDDITVAELLKKQQEKDIESTNYDYCSIAEIQSKTAQGSDLIKVLYVFENYMSGVSEEAADEESSIRVESAREQTNYGISISGFENEGKLGFKIMYDPNKYCDEEIHLIMERLLKICEEMANKPDAKICELETVTEAEKQLILNDFNATETEYPRDKTVVELFEEQVRKTPDNTALVFEEESLTYAELNARANSLAYKLRENGVKPDDFVAIIADRSIEMICGIYGIIKAGGAYVPIDPTYPEERIRFMLEDCQPKAVLKYTAESIKLNNEIAVIDLADGKVWEGASENPEHVNTANDLIYCIYTSGTTGKPKGVMLQNSSVVNYCYKHNYSVMDYAYKNNLKTMLSVTNMVFDIFVTELHLALINGYKIILASSAEQVNPEKLSDFIYKYKPDIMQTTPSRIKMILSDKKENGMDQLKYIMLGGEKVERDLVNRLRTKTTAVIENVYGPTETTVWSTCCEVDNEDGQVSIGKPISNTQIYIVNGNNLCGIGIPGELCIAGEGLARGYLNRPELTAEKFVKNPFGEGRMYRSGDLAKWLPDGNIEYLGRIDEQVKIRGFRIELGEIESRIREIEGIRDCAVTARADSTGDKAIYAYYTSDTEVSVSEIRDRLSESLPEYMVPAYMTQIESIPVTRNGKLDKRALPEIEAKATREYAAPRNEIEEKICNIFSEILNVEQVGIKDSFFELGGHSLRATRLVNRIEAETGTRIALKEVFSHPTAEQLAVLAGAESEEYVPIPKAEEKEYYPMSSAQKRTYLIQQMQPEAVTYNMPQNMKLMGEVYPEKLKEAMQEMINRHEILRTQFLMIDGEPVQKIIDYVEADFEYVTSNEPDEKLISEYMKPFDLESGKTIRAKLVNKGEYHLLTLDMHHIVGDGMSMNTFMREVMALYNGEKLEPLTRQFKDYSEWMRSRDLRGQEEYWKSRFEDEIPVLDMPTDYPRPQEQSYAGTMTGAALDEEASQGVKKLISRSGATDYMVFLAAAMVTLSKYSRQEDIVIGSPISGRTHRDTESMLGMFVNTLAMRGKPEKKKTFIRFLKEIKSTCLKAYENQEYPFEELVEAAEVQRDMSRNPLFDVMLVMQNNESTELRLGNSSIEGTVIESTVAKFDMTFNINEYNGRYVIGFEYCTDLFKKETAERILEHYIEILKAVTENAEQKISEIEMATPEERKLILNDFNATETEYPRDKTVVELFEEQVRKTPDNTALVFGKESLTYAELNARANSLAYKLRENGVKPDDFVAIIADRSIEMICGIYGIIKAGGAYVPIDPTYPEERIRFMLEDCQPKAVLKYTAESIKLNNEIPVIDLADGKVWEGASENPEHVNTANDLIYCIYTSGTTGKPKGTMLEHHGVVNLKYYFANRMGINGNDRVLQFANYIFDASVWEMTMALLNGAALVCVPAGLAQDTKAFNEYCAKNEVTVATLPPNYYVQEDVKLNLRLIITAGSESNKFILEKSKDSEYINAYGPTETTVCATYWKRPEGFEVSTAPIGVPIDNFRTYIMNGENLCGIGVPGELCIAGDGLARGYLNRPELTAEKFVKNPFGEGRMYRSGDLARWLSDGNIEYLGRIDEQVKIRGFRIELGEIESRIREIEGIRDCAVTARADSTGDKAIYAYYTSDTEVSLSEIRDRLSESLPEYMVPAYMTQIESIPVTRNGKLDKRALPEIETKNTREYAAPRNEIEEAVCHAFSEILNAEQVGIKDSFFELGGDSIKAIRIISKLRNAGYTATVKDVMNGKTAEKIAFVVKNANEKQKYEQGEVTGKIESTPIIREFAEWNLAKPEHFNQAMMFSVDGIENEVIKQAIEELVKHHDALRAVYRDNVLEILPVAESRLCDFYEFDYRNEADKPSAVAEKCTEIQGSVDLENGPLVKIAVFELGETKQMMFCIHHLAVDGVSWRILSEDFETAAGQLKEGKEVVLPEKTASFAEWSKKLKEYGEQLGSKEKDYWKKANAKIAEGKIAGEYYGEENGIAVAEFSKETTEKLLTKSSNAYGAKIDEVLIAGLARAVGRVTGQKSVAIKLEGHGREEIHEPISIDRTVGWFTNVYAVSVECSEDNDEAIINAKDTIRSVPNMGMGYGYAEHETMPDICFNYLGDFGNKSESLEVYSCGRDISEENSLPDRITINGQVMNGVLKFIIMSLNGQNLADRLKKEFEKSVDELAEYCTNNNDDNESKTMSDMTESIFDDDDLDFVGSLLN